MHGHMSRCTVTCHDTGHMSRCTITCHDARSHVTIHGHMPRCTVTCHDARSHVTMHGHMNVKFEGTCSPAKVTLTNDYSVAAQGTIICTSSLSTYLAGSLNENERSCITVSGDLEKCFFSMCNDCDKQPYIPLALNIAGKGGKSFR